MLILGLKGLMESANLTPVCGRSWAHHRKGLAQADCLNKISFGRIEGSRCIN